MEVISIMSLSTNLFCTYVQNYIVNKAWYGERECVTRKVDLANESSGKIFVYDEPVARRRMRFLVGTK